MNATAKTQYPTSSEVDLLSGENLGHPYPIAFQRGILDEPIPIFNVNVNELSLNIAAETQQPPAYGIIPLSQSGTAGAIFQDLALGMTCASANIGFGAFYNTLSAMMSIPQRNRGWNIASAWDSTLTAESMSRSLHLHMLLGEFLRTRNTPIDANIATRIEALYRDSNEDGEMPLSLDSVSSFLSFFKYMRQAQYPDITLTLTGNLYVTWGRSVHRKLSLEFNKGRVKYVFFYRSNYDDIASAKGLGEVPLNDFSHLFNQMPRQIKDIVLNNG